MAAERWALLASQAHTWLASLVDLSFDLNKRLPKAGIGSWHVVKDLSRASMGRVEKLGKSRKVKSYKRLSV